MGMMFMNTDIPLMLLVTVQLYRPCCLQSSKLSNPVKNVNHRNILCYRRVQEGSGGFPHMSLVPLKGSFC